MKYWAFLNFITCISCVLFNHVLSIVYWLRVFLMFYMFFLFIYFCKVNFPLQLVVFLATHTVLVYPMWDLVLRPGLTLLLFSLCRIWLFVTLWTAARQGFLSFTIS